jgi:hypothetical protein
MGILDQFRTVEKPISSSDISELKMPVRHILRTGHRRDLPPSSREESAVSIVDEIRWTMRT